MSIFKDTIENLWGHSLAMYSTWLYHTPTRVLFDAGEGVSLDMRNFVFGIDKVFLSHGHYDHIGGLAGILHSRASARGDKEKPLTVYYPQGCGQIDAFKDHIGATLGHIHYDLEWVPLAVNAEIQVGKHTVVQSFAVQHSGPCYGYRLVETRKRLKSGLADKSPEEIAQLAQEQGAEAVREWYKKVVLAYSGDAFPVCPDDVRDAEVLIHEATFLDEADRKGDIHSSAREAIKVAQQANAGSLILFHISGRYDLRDVERQIRDIAREIGWQKPLAVLIGRKLIDLSK